MLAHLLRLRPLILPVALLGYAALVARGHAITHTPVSGGVGIEARYDDGSPAAFCTVQVFPPGSTQLFAEGMTDREGRFVVAAATGGTWTLTVDDGMGHALTASLPVEDGRLRPAAAATRMSRWQGLATGVGTIFGCFGLWALWRGRVRRSAT